MLPGGYRRGLLGGCARRRFTVVGRFGVGQELTSSEIGWQPGLGRVRAR